MKRVARAIGVLAVGALVGISPILADSPPPQRSAVAIQTFQFKPSPVEVNAGTQVAWTNNDDILHTVTSGTPENPDGRFHSPLPGKSAAFSVTFAEPGTYAYFCKRHQSMRGEVRVR
jgi:plastocyanin